MTIRSPIEYVLWDWNGTLLDDISLCIDTLSELCRRRGLPPVSREDYLEYFDFPVIRFYASLGFDTSEEAFRLLATEWASLYLPRLHTHAGLFPGTNQTLDAISAQGIPQAMLSAHHRDTLIDAVTQFGLHLHFEDIFGPDDYHGDSKETLGLDWIASSGIDPSHVILFGDTLHDAHVAQAMGIQCALIAQGHQSRHRLQSTGLPILDNIQQALSLL